MSFACLWITNLWGEFLQMEFSMPCALCFKHCKQTNKSILDPELLQLPPIHLPPLSCLSPSGDLQLSDSGCKGSSAPARTKHHRWNILSLGKQKQPKDKKRAKYHLKFSSGFLFVFGLNYNHHPSRSQHFYSCSWLETWQMNVGINGVSCWEGRWMLSLWGEAGEVQLVLAEGQSSCVSPDVTSGSRSRTLLVPCYLLSAVSKWGLRIQLPPSPALSLPTHLQDMSKSIKAKLEFVQKAFFFF